MPTPARIALVACVVVLGTAAAWRFRKAPEMTTPIAERGSGLLLRDGGTIAAGDGVWRPLSSPRARPKSPLASIGVGDLSGAATPPLPIPHALRRGPVVHENDGGAAAIGLFESSPADGEPVLHVVVDGDTLASLAQRYLGSAARAEEILRANRRALVNPEILPIGVTLEIPGRTHPASGNRPR